jgi:hypothetical protein
MGTIVRYVAKTCLITKSISLKKPYLTKKTFNSLKEFILLLCTILDLGAPQNYLPVISDFLVLHQHVSPSFERAHTSP